MAKIHIRQRRHNMFGLYTGKRCLIYGSRSTIYGIGLAIRAKRAAEKGQAS